MAGLPPSAHRSRIDVLKRSPSPGQAVASRVCGPDVLCPHRWPSSHRHQSWTTHTSEEVGVVEVSRFNPAADQEPHLDQFVDVSCQNRTVLDVIRYV
jgi:hypothetical protein